MKISTAAKELQFIRSVFSLCKCEWGLIKQSPFEFFKMPSVNDQRVRFLEPGEFERLISSCPKWLKPIVILVRYTGLRRGNILGLTWSQVDLKNRVIYLDLKTNRTKNMQNLAIPLLGHKDGRMTQRYAHLKIETLRNAIESLEGGHKKGHSKNEKEVASHTTS